MKETLGLTGKLKQRRRKLKNGRPVALNGFGTEHLDWEQWKNEINFFRRQVKLPIVVVAAIIGVSPPALKRKMKFWNMRMRLKEYAPREVRDDYIERFRVKHYTQAYNFRKAGEK